MGGRVHYGVPNKGRLGSGVPHRELCVLHMIVEAVAGDLGASQASSQLSGEGGGADEGKSSCLMSRMGVARVSGRSPANAILRTGLYSPVSSMASWRLGCNLLRPTAA